MSRPTDLPVWNTDATNRTTPSSGYQASGWNSGDPADSAYDNWYKNLAYQWVSYFAADQVLPLAVHHKDGLITLDGSNSDSLSVPLIVGATINAIQIIYSRGSSVLQVALKYIDATGTDNLVETVLNDSTSSGWQNTTPSLTTAHTVAADRLYRVKLGIDSDSPDATIAGIAIHYTP